jgi:hypothetical protein
MDNSRFSAPPSLNCDNVAQQMLVIAGTELIDQLASSDDGGATAANSTSRGPTQ